MFYAAPNQIWISFTDMPLLVRFFPDALVENIKDNMVNLDSSESESDLSYSDPEYVPSSDSESSNQ